VRQKHLDDLAREAGVTPEWRQLLRDLDRLQQVRLAHRGADWLVRTDAAPNVAALFRAAHIALPPRARQVAPAKAAPPSQKRRGRARGAGLRRSLLQYRYGCTGVTLGGQGAEIYA